ncbi:MAG: hypothetical protein D3910_00340 [Candidatus Electrothrix sp. ATG2]|nr:hypothetical protein [Candidatus Electrothrix sp. ATG2]
MGGGDRFRASVAQALVGFIRQEIMDVGEGKRTSSVNCASEELRIFAEQIGACTDGLKMEWQALCPAGSVGDEPTFQQSFQRLHCEL